MHCPNVVARTATPPGTNCVCGMIATSVTPSIAMTCASFRTASAVPLIVGGRQTIVGSAPGTSRSIANCFVPVTISSASIRGCGVPTSVCCEAGFSCASTACVREAAAALVSEPYESDRAVRRRDHAVLERQLGQRRLELLGRRQGQLATRDRRRDPDLVVERMHRVRPAGQLVELELRPRIGQRDVDLVER